MFTCVACWCSRGVNDEPCDDRCNRRINIIILTLLDLRRTRNRYSYYKLTALLLTWFNYEFFFSFNAGKAEIWQHRLILMIMLHSPKGSIFVWANYSFMQGMHNTIVQNVHHARHINLFQFIFMIRDRDAFIDQSYDRMMFLAKISHNAQQGSISRYVTTILHLHPSNYRKQIRYQPIIVL